MTITEALAEIKTIEKRVAKMREFVLTYLLRQEQFKDPLEREGGSVSAVRRELQAVQDLEERKVELRRAIQLVNSRSPLTVGGRTRSVADWLAWRREVAPQWQSFLVQVRQRIELARQEAARRGANLSPGHDAPGRPGDVVVNVSEQELAREIENLEETLGQLDGQLSLKNATLLIEV
jgi:hypothetical protein